MKEKPNFWFFQFLFLELWSFLCHHPNFRWIFHDNSRKKNGLKKNYFVFHSIQHISHHLWTPHQNWGDEEEGRGGLHIHSSFPKRPYALKKCSWKDLGGISLPKRPVRGGHRHTPSWSSVTSTRSLVDWVPFDNWLSGITGLRFWIRFVKISHVPETWNINFVKRRNHNSKISDEYFHCSDFDKNRGKIRFRTI